MRKVGERRKQPKYAFHFAFRPILYMPEGENGMKSVQASSWAIKEFGYHIYFLNVHANDLLKRYDPLHIVFHVRSGLPIEAFEDKKSAAIKVKRLETGIDPSWSVDFTPRNPQETNDDIPF